MSLKHIFLHTEAIFEGISAAKEPVERAENYIQKSMWWQEKATLTPDVGRAGDGRLREVTCFQGCRL